MKKLGSAILVVLMLLSCSLAFLGSVPSIWADDWLMSHHDVSRNGVSTETITGTNHTVIWTYARDGYLGNEYSSPAVHDGRVFIGGNDHVIRALNASTGAWLWSYDTGSSVQSSPVVDGGLVYCGCYDGIMVALNETTGTLKWSKNVVHNIFSSPAVANGVVYFGSEDSFVYAQNSSTGADVWNHTLPSWADSSPSVDTSENLLFIGCYDAGIYALNLATGAEVWSHILSQVIMASPTIYDSLVFVPSFTSLYCYDEVSGVLQWNSHISSVAIFSTPVVKDGVVYQATQDDKICALTTMDGDSLYNMTFGGASEQSPIIVNDVLYIGSYDYRMYAFNLTTHTEMWHYLTGQHIYSTPAFSNGILYFGSEDHKVYAIETLPVGTQGFGGASDVGSGDFYATIEVNQRNNFYANLNFWTFWSDGSDLVYSSSLTGLQGDWTAKAILRVGVTEGDLFSIAFNGTYVSYAYTPAGSSASLYYGLGTPNQNGTITMRLLNGTATAEQTVGSGLNIWEPSIAVDSAGYPWVLYGGYTSGGTPYVTKSSTNDGRWTTSADFPYQLSATGTGSWTGQIVPMTNLRMLAVYAYGSSTVRAKQWSGSSWNTSELVSSSAIYSAGNFLSATNQSDSVSIAFLTVTTYNIQYVNYTYANNSFASEQTIQASATVNASPSISINTNNNTLYCFWGDATNQIYYKQCVNGVWDSSATDWIDESANGLTGSGQRRIQASYTSYGGYIGVEYLHNTSSYYVRFAFLNLTNMNYNTYSHGFSVNPSVIDTAEVTINGTVETMPYTLNVPSADTYEVEASTPVVYAAENYYFVSWLVNGTDTYYANPLVLLLAGNTTFQANYQELVVPTSSDALSSTWYFRSDLWTVHTVLGYKLQPDNTMTPTSDSLTDSGSLDTVTYGFKVYLIDFWNSTTELTSDPQAVMSVSGDTSGMMTASWNCPEWSTMIDTIKVEVYLSFDGGATWSLRRTFITKTELLITLPAATWTFHLWINNTQTTDTIASMWHGSYDTYDSRIDLYYYKADPWQVAQYRLYQLDLLGWLFTPWTYWIGDVFWAMALFFVCVTSIIYTNSLKPILAWLWIFGGSGSLLWALVPPLALHVAVLMLVVAMAFSLFKLVWGKRT